VKNLVLVCRQISVASERAKFDEAAAQLSALRSEIASAVETLKAAGNGPSSTKTTTTPISRQSVR